MIWLSWRRQRTETLIAAGFLALIAALVIPTGLHMASAYNGSGLAACLGANTSVSCTQAIEGFTSRFDGLDSLLAWLTLVPGLVGVLLAAPFVLELENGTYRLAWTQSITRRRWIVGKLGLASGAALLAALTFTALMTWWHAPLVHLEGRMDPSVFDSEGTVVFAYTLFALGLATAVGAIWRRGVPALVVAFAGYFASRLFVDTWLRQRLVAPLSATWHNNQPEPASLHRAWVMSEEPSNKLGHAVSPITSCGRAIGSHVTRIDPSCLVKHRTDYTHAVYQPASHFWALQGVETALFGGVALVLLAFAAWWTHQRTA